MRPTQRPPPGEPVRLRDEDVPDFLDAHPRAALAFAGRDDDAFLARVTLAAARVEGVGVGVVDLTRDRLVADALGVKAAPCLLVFRDGEHVDRVMGAPPDDVLVDMLRRA